MRSGRGQRDEFMTFYTRAYPELVAQVLAITGDARIAKAATDITLAKVWRSWPSLRQSSDPLMRARWSAVLVAAEHEPSGAEPADAVAEITGGDGEDAVVVAALQLLPPVQRRALVLHYMGGVTVNDLAALSGSSAEHIEVLLDDGFTTLAETLDWAEDDLVDDALASPDAGADGGADDGAVSEFDDADYDDDLDLRFDWTAEALADTAARLPDEITAPSPAAMLRRAALVRWSTRAVPVAAGAACVAVAVIVAAQPGAPPDLSRPAIYAQNDYGSVTDAPALDTTPDPSAPVAGPIAARSADPVRMRSVALTSLLGPPQGGSPEAASGSGASQSAAGVSSASSSSGGGGTAAAAGSGTTGTSGGTSSTPASSGTTTTTPAGTTTTAPAGSTTTPTSTTTVPPITTTPPATSTTPPVPATTTDPTTTTPPVVTTDPITTQPVTPDPTTTTPPVVTTTTVVHHTTITTPTSVLEITTTTVEPTTTTVVPTTTEETTTAAATTSDSTDETSKSDS